jgi:hypothetical protein
MEFAMLPGTQGPAICAVCHRPDAEWLSCSSPVCDIAEAGALAQYIAALSAPSPWPLGARCMARIGRECIEGVITAKLTLASGVQGAYVQLDGHGDMVALPLVDVQVIR